MSTANLSLGKPDETWAKYGLRQHPIEFNGQISRAKAVIRNNDQLITIAGKGYTLLPNEEALKMANEAAKLAGFVPFFEKMMDGKWEQGRTRGNVLCNNKETQMHAFYVPKELDVEKLGIRGDNVYVGVDVVNSIDGKKSFGVGTFSFRSACKNGVLWGSQNLGSVRHAHTKALQGVIEQLKTLFVTQMDNALQVLEGYKRMTDQKATIYLAERLAKSRIPDKILPLYITDEEQRKKLPGQGITNWQVYNDVTAGIWHNTENDVSGKEFQFNQLHKVMPVLTVPTRRVK